jgi:hypothetical protein
MSALKPIRSSSSRTLEIDPQRVVKLELKGPLLRLTHCLSSSAPPRSHPNPHPSGLFSHFIKLAVHLENGNPG